MGRIGNKTKKIFEKVHFAAWRLDARATLAAVSVVRCCHSFQSKSGFTRYRATKPVALVTKGEKYLLLLYIRVSNTTVSVSGRKINGKIFRGAQVVSKLGTANRKAEVSRLNAKVGSSALPRDW